MQATERPNTKWDEIKRLDQRMSDSTQAQKAGAHSNQYQIAGDLVVVEGVTEDRAFEIAREAAKDVLSGLSLESGPVANDRIDKLDVRVVQKLRDAGLLGALGDPAVQVTLRKAQLGAASSERESDYDLLASLLEDRVKRPGDRPVRAGINRAVEVVDQLDDSALLGLTLMQALVQYKPMAAEADEGIQIMERFLSQLVPDLAALPTGAQWIEHLDVLDAVRVQTVQTFKPFDEFWPAKTPGYVAVGLPTISESIVDAHRALVGLGMSGTTVPHRYKPGFERFPQPYSEALETVLERQGFKGKLVEDAVALARDQFLVDQVDPELTPKYMAEVRQQPVLGGIAEWWSGLAPYFTITTVGRVLARANAQRLDKLSMLPPLD